MRKLTIPSQRVDTLLHLLSTGSGCDVIDRLPGTGLPGAFVLLKSGWSWGHFYVAAFCAVTEVGQDTVELRVSHLNIQRAWHGANLFRFVDQKIEDEICEFVRRRIPEAKYVEGT